MADLVEPCAAAERVLCLAAVFGRAFFEIEIARVHEVSSDMLESIQLLDRWLRQESLREKLSAREKALMAKDFGEWTKQDQIGGAWEKEAAGCIAWALGLAAMPPYDTQFSEAQVKDAIPKIGWPTHQWVAEASLRDEQEVREARDIAENWLWRFRKEMILRNARPPFSEGAFRQRIRQFIAESALKCQDEGQFQIIEDDYPALGKAYAKLTEPEWHSMGGIATSRLCSLNWLCGQERDWDSITCDT